MSTTIAHLTFLLALVGSAHAQTEAVSPVHEFTLENGLKLIIKQDHRAPVVVSQVWYKVGSSYEHNGITGISHMLEHMMFKGTEKLEPGEFSRIVAENGGLENAFTGADYTAYFQQLETSRLEVSLELEAERMRNLVLTDDELKTERMVVMEERRQRTEDRPRNQTYEHFAGVAFQNSPYQHPIIGWMGDIEGYRIEDLKQWYRRWYAPNNATVVVVGDVQPKAVLELARKHFGGIARAELEPVRVSPEVPQLGPRRLAVRSSAALPYVLIGFKAPVLRNASEPWEPYALEVLAAILNGDSSARLDKHLVRGDEVAAKIWASYDPYQRLRTLFEIGATPTPDTTAESLEGAIREQIARLRAEPPEGDELERVQTRLVAQNVFARDSLFYQAMQLGTLETVGLGHQLLDEYVEKVRAVTPEQVHAVAEKYLIEDAMTVAWLEPQPPAEKAARREGQSGEN